MRAIILIMDSFGIGATPDAERFGDQGASTIGHIAQWCRDGRADSPERSGPLRIPNLERLGIGLAARLATGELPAGFNPQPDIIGAWAAAREISSGKDTPSGHWELAGVPIRFDWGYFEKKDNTFPPTLLENLVRRFDLPGWLGNCHASGTTIIAEMGEEHVRTGRPIFYTSSDSVFQIACHEESFGLQRLYDLCEIAFEEVRPYNICRVIARPFIGTTADTFKRTGNRRDLAVKPPAPTVLEKLSNAGGTVVGIGKIPDIYAHVGITRSIKASGHNALWDTTLRAMKDTGPNSIIMTNFVDFDQTWGHRRDVAGYAAGLEHFDNRLPELMACLGKNDVLLVSADHGCDPTWQGSDHTREHVPVLAFGHRIPPGNEGIRETFADVGQSLAHMFRLSPFPDGIVMPWARALSP
ncbi:MULTISPECIES: phosphopentomutase [unclassified Haematospirillum]|uniref:phosphopentomutase n=1 Tax=unclassified Haematospirillum TaxID=2622088 RepID=UPI00143C2BDC|nr:MULTISPECIES: phosphopentomutase [unclassified Haematospirillum]NKD54035.1 phosphopentomutase [Haematospirillum sp. H4890]NKD74080.1 phosphopentomutase [Haematospirillum sp. H4485]